VEEDGGELILEAREGVSSEVDTVTVLEILVEEDKTKIIVNQLIRELINKRFTTITVKSIDIMHMIAEIDSIIRTSKDKISQTVKIVPRVLCLWRALKQCL
jgi:predicted component of type VI protein secretion system